jgi:hypothetical protein
MIEIAGGILIAAAIIWARVFLLKAAFVLFTVIITLAAILGPVVWMHEKFPAWVMPAYVWAVCLSLLTLKGCMDEFCKKPIKKQLEEEA